MLTTTKKQDEITFTNHLLFYCIFNDFSHQSSVFTSKYFKNLPLFSTINYNMNNSMDQLFICIPQNSSICYWELYFQAHENVSIEFTHREWERNEIWNGIDKYMCSTNQLFTIILLFRIRCIHLSSPRK